MTMQHLRQSLAVAHTIAHNMRNPADRSVGTHATGRAEEGVLFSTRPRTAVFLTLGCPCHFQKYGIGADTYVRCDYCGTELDHEPGDPTVWQA